MSKPAQVWSRFTRIQNRKELKFRIQEVPKDKIDGVFELLFKYFVPEEPVHKASQITEEETLAEYKKVVAHLAKEMNYQVDACCLDDDCADLKIVAGSIMVLEKKGDAAYDEQYFKGMAKSAEFTKFFEISMTMASAFKVIDEYNLDVYYDDRGIVVHPDYRGLGIAGELFKARVVTCKNYGVPMTGAWMTSIGSQKAAAKQGWETVCELKYKDLEDKLGVKFEGAPPSCKLMVIKV